MPRRGLEPLRLSAPDPKSGASANFATLASGQDSHGKSARAIAKVRNFAGGNFEKSQREQESYYEPFVLKTRSFKALNSRRMDVTLCISASALNSSSPSPASATIRP